MVLAHRSSINDSQGYFTLDAINPEKNPDWAKCYNKYEPGTGYMYCNLNYNMVGTIIEKISGQRFDQYVKNHILDPLNLYGGYCVDSLEQSRFATIYEYNTTTKNFNRSTRGLCAAQGRDRQICDGIQYAHIFANGRNEDLAADLAQYMIMHMNQGRYKGKKIISKKSARQCNQLI